MKKYLLCLLLAVSTMIYGQNHEKTGLQNISDLMVQWASTPGSDNDKKLAVLQPGSEVNISDRVYTKRERDGLGVCYIAYYQEKQFICYDAEQELFTYRSTSPTQIKQEGKLIVWILSSILFLFGMMLVLFGWKESYRRMFYISYFKIHRFRLLKITGVIVVCAYINFFLGILLSLTLLVTVVYHLWRRRQRKPSIGVW